MAAAPTVLASAFSAYVWEVVWVSDRPFEGQSHDDPE
jgi:hypothetical protein